MHNLVSHLRFVESEGFGVRNVDGLALEITKGAALTGGTIRLKNGAVINNRAGSIFDVQTTVTVAVDTVQFTGDEALNNQRCHRCSRW